MGQRADCRKLSWSLTNTKLPTEALLLIQRSIGRLAVLRRVANLAYRRWGWLSDPIGAKIELLPENPARERFLDRSELAKLLRGIPNRSMRKAALVAAFTGLRRGELAKLRPVNVQGDLIYLKTTKSGRPRTVPVVHHVLFALRRLPFGVHADTLTHAVQRAMPVCGFMTYGIQQLASSSHPASICTALARSLDIPISELRNGTLTWR
jgi:integrase